MFVFMNGQMFYRVDVYNWHKFELRYNYLLQLIDSWMQTKLNLPVSDSKNTSEKEGPADTIQKGEKIKFRNKQNDEDRNLSVTNFKLPFDLDNQSNFHLSGMDAQANLQEQSDAFQFIVGGPTLPVNDSEKNSEIPNQKIWDGKEEEIKMAKNTNVLKHILRNFIEKGFSRSLKKQFEGYDKKILNEILGFIQKQKNLYQSQDNHNNNIKSMVRIFEKNPTSKDPQLRSFLLRRHLAHCLRKVLIKGIFNNKQISSLRKSYVYSMLMQIYRCGNIELMKRTEII